MPLAPVRRRSAGGALNDRVDVCAGRKFAVGAGRPVAQAAGAEGVGHEGGRVANQQRSLEGPGQCPRQMTGLRLGRNGRARVVREFDADAMAARLRAVLFDGSEP